MGVGNCWLVHAISAVAVGAGSSVRALGHARERL